MTLPLELGQVSDPSARRALEQISLRWPQEDGGGTTPSSATFVSGTGAPTAAVGADGAIYLDTASGCMYGPKAAGAWPGTPIGRLVTDAMTYDQESKGN